MISGIQYWLPTSFFPSFPTTEAKISSFDDLYDLNDLTQIMTADDCDLDQWMTWKSDIKEFIEGHSEDLEQLNEFFNTITQWGMERNPHKAMSILVDIVSLDILTDAVRFKQENSDHTFENIFDWAAEHASLFPDPPDTSIKGQCISEWKRCRPIILYFIPNLINIFLGAFNFIDTHKTFTTLWEKHLLLEIIYKFFIIPYCLIQILQPIFVVTAKVYIIAAAIIVTTGILISCYQRWFRPLPDEIVNCTNLDNQMEMGFLDPKVGQTEEIDRLIAALEVDANVILIGLSGEGKTALIHHFIQLKHEGKLSKKLERLTVFESDCGLMISSVNFGHSELINQIKDQIGGYEDRVLLFFDEFQQIVSTKGAFQAFKKRFLEDEPHAKFVAAVTCKEWEELKKLDMDYSFRRRIVRIRMEPSSDDQIRAVIKNYIDRFAQDIPITDEAIDAVIDITDQEDYLPEIGRPAKAIEIFKLAIGLCRAAYHQHYVSVNLSKDQLKINQKQVLKIKKIIAHQQKINTQYYHLTHLFSKAVPKKEELDEVEDFDIDMDHLEEIDIFDGDEEEDLKKESSVRETISKDSFNEKDQIKYLWYSFYALDAVKNILDREIAKVDSQIAIQVDKNLIYRVYEEIRQIEENDEIGIEEV